MVGILLGLCKITASTLLRAPVVTANPKFDLQPYDFMMFSYFPPLSYGRSVNCFSILIIHLCFRVGSSENIVAVMALLGGVKNQMYFCCIILLHWLRILFSQDPGD